VLSIKLDDFLDKQLKGVQEFLISIKKV